MFYTAELNLKGKGPLSRLWQACHYPNKISKKVIETFDYKEGYEAILEPESDRVWALRLNGQLLLGYVRIHGMKVALFEDIVKTSSDRVKYRFTSHTPAVDLDLSKTAKGRSESKRSEDLMMSVVDLDFLLEIPDEVPTWLKSDEWEMSQTQSDRFSQVVPGSSPGRLSAISSRNRSYQINLPDHRVSSVSGYGTTEDDHMYDDMLMPENEMPEELAMYENFVAVAESSGNGGASSSGHGGEMDNYDNYNDMHHPLEENKNSTKTAKRPCKRSRKSGLKLDVDTQVPKDECRKWVTDDEWVKNHLCKPRRPLGTVKNVSVLKRLSMPIASGHGGPILDLYEKFAYPVRSAKKARSSKKRSADESERSETNDPTGGGDNREVEKIDIGYDYYGDFDAGDVNYGDPSSEASGSQKSAKREDPERMRAGSEDSRASSQGLNKKDWAGMSPDGMSYPSFDIVTPQSPRRSSLFSGSERASRLASIGEVYDPLSLNDDNYDDTPFKDASLKEEPESLTQTGSQIPISQRLSEHSILVARQISLKLPDDDSELTFQNLTRNLNTRNKARCFYSALLLINENVVKAVQDTPYGDIVFTATENTAMYSS